MRLILISREYPPDTHVGGIATYTQMVAEMFSTRGHEVHVLCNGRRTGILRRGDLTIHRIAMGNHPLPQGRFAYRLRAWVRTHLPSWLDAVTWARTVGQYAERHLRPERGDVWEWPETNGEGAYLPAWVAQSPTFCRIHSAWLDESWRNGFERWMLLRLQRRACRRAERVISPSRAMATDYARRKLGLKAVEVAPNPIRNWFQPLHLEGKRKERLLFVGRMEYRKGIDILVGACRILAVNNPSLVVRLVGALHPPSSPRDEKAQSELAQGLRDFSQGPLRLEYYPACAREELYQHLDWAGLLVMPTRMDNYPYVLLEGLARGCCLLTSDIGGIREICGDQAFAQCIPPGDPEVLAEKMRQWLKGSADHSPLWRQAAAFFAERFGEESGYRRQMKLYGGEMEP